MENRPGWSGRVEKNKKKKKKGEWVGSISARKGFGVLKNIFLFP
jgi:hypothetical protein